MKRALQTSLLLLTAALLAPAQTARPQAIRKEAVDAILARSLGGIPGAKEVVRRGIRPYLDKVVVDRDAEVEAGERMARHWKQVFGAALDANAGDVEYLNKVGKALVARLAKRKDLPYTFHMVEAEVSNAFAHAGGHVYLFRGLFSTFEHEAELASVLAHEVAHVEREHVVEFVKPIAAYRKLVEKYPLFAKVNLEHLVGELAGKTLLGFTHEAVEFEADDRGLELVAACGYDPRQCNQILRKVEAAPAAPRKVGEMSQAVLEALSQSHPNSRLRRDHARKKAEALVKASKGTTFHTGERNLAERVPLQDKVFTR